MNVRSDAVVLFGVTGDLVSKKLFPAFYELTSRRRIDVPVIGVARSPWDDQDLVTAARKSVAEVRDHIDEETFDALAQNLRMIHGDYADPGTYQQLAQALGDSERPLFYLAIPPTVFGSVVAGLATAGLAKRGRVIVEKPFGHDLKSANELNRTLQAAFEPEHIFRIDHYLGKESVEGLKVFRFANRLFEPLWNHDHIDSVQVTRLRLGRDDGITMSIQVKNPGADVTSRTVRLGVDFDAILDRRSEAYERLLQDAIDGLHLRFVREDTIDQQWRVVEPILDLPDKVTRYAKGSWGPTHAKTLTNHWYTDGSNRP